MFQKVLVSEDEDGTSVGIVEALNSLGIANITTVQYCDTAYLKLKEEATSEPYDLFITDLGFKRDARLTTIKSGEELLHNLSKELEIHTIVYTTNHKLSKARLLFEKYNINGYVCKGRSGLEDLKNAVKAINEGHIYFSEEVKDATTAYTNLAIDDYDLLLIEQLALGKSKYEISEHFMINDISPASISSIEKRQNKLLVTLEARNATHLISIVKDLGLV
jgi:DNA-binding NarL/FixJ family response regulator